DVAFVARPEREIERHEAVRIQGERALDLGRRARLVAVELERLRELRVRDGARPARGKGGGGRERLLLLAERAERCPSRGLGARVRCIARLACALGREERGAVAVFARVVRRLLEKIFDAAWLLVPEAF